MSYISDKHFAKAVCFIYENIDQPLSLETIAKSLLISTTSLKRLFEEAINQSPGLFVRKLRMEMAFRSLKNRSDSILEIALASGFEDHSAFSRCFKKTFGFSPASAKEKINLVNELECVVLQEPDIIEVEGLEIYCVTETGLYFESAPRAWQELRKNLTAEEQSEDFAGFFVGIAHDNPHEGLVNEDQVRFTAGVSFINRKLSLSKMKTGSGLYARFHFRGKPTNMGLAYHYIYGQWNEKSEWKINTEVPAFVVHPGFPDAFKEADLLIHVPLLSA
jgi:AraC-like DNA-binding protein/DNA gyrase inhibitor GyrI